MKVKTFNKNLNIILSVGAPYLALLSVKSNDNSRDKAPYRMQLEKLLPK